MGFQTQGTIVRIDETKEISDEFKKREFAIEISDDRYPQTCLFQLAQDKCRQLDGVGIGDVVDVDFDLRGREWTSPKTGEVKVFNTLDCWRLKVITRSQTPAMSNDGEDEIPF